MITLVKGIKFYRSNNLHSIEIEEYSKSIIDIFLSNTFYRMSLAKLSRYKGHIYAIKITQAPGLIHTQPHPHPLGGFELGSPC